MNSPKLPSYIGGILAVVIAVTAPAPSEKGARINPGTLFYALRQPEAAQTGLEEKLREALRSPNDLVRTAGTLASTVLGLNPAARTGLEEDDSLGGLQSFLQREDVTGGANQKGKGIRGRTLTGMGQQSYDAIVFDQFNLKGLLRAPFKTSGHSRESGNLRGKPDLRFREDDVLKGVLSDLLRDLNREGPFTWADVATGPGVAPREGARLFSNLRPLLVDAVPWKPDQYDPATLEGLAQRAQEVGAGEFFSDQFPVHIADALTVDLKPLLTPEFPLRAITMINALAYNKDPLGIVANLFNQLEPGGVLVTNLYIPTKKRVEDEDGNTWEEDYPKADALARFYGRLQDHLKTTLGVEADFRIRDFRDLQPGELNSQGEAGPFKEYAVGIMLRRKDGQRLELLRPPLEVEEVAIVNSAVREVTYQVAGYGEDPAQVIGLQVTGLEELPEPGTYPEIEAMQQAELDKPGVKEAIRSWVDGQSAPIPSQSVFDFSDQLGIHADVVHLWLGQNGYFVDTSVPLFVWKKDASAGGGSTPLATGLEESWNSKIEERIRWLRRGSNDQRDNAARDIVDWFDLRNRNLQHAMRFSADRLVEALADNLLDHRKTDKFSFQKALAGLAIRPSFHDAINLRLAELVNQSFKNAVQEDDPGLHEAAVEFLENLYRLKRFRTTLKDYGVDLKLLKFWPAPRGSWDLDEAAHVISGWVSSGPIEAVYLSEAEEPLPFAKSVDYGKLIRELRQIRMGKVGQFELRLETGNTIRVIPLQPVTGTRTRSAGDGSTPLTTGLEEIQVKTVAELARMRDDAGARALALALAREKKAGVVLLPKGLVDSQPLPQERRQAVVYAHKEVGQQMISLLPMPWDWDGQVNELNADPARANEQLEKAQESVKQGKTVVIALDAGVEIETLRLSMVQAVKVRLDPQTSRNLVSQLKPLLAFLSRPDLLKNVVLDLTSGSVRVVTIQGTEYYALDVAA